VIIGGGFQTTNRSRGQLVPCKTNSQRTQEQNQSVMNRLDPIEELYDMYSEEEDTPKIVEIEDNELDFVLDIEGPADPYMDL